MNAGTKTVRRLASQPSEPTFPQYHLAQTLTLYQTGQPQTQYVAPVSSASPTLHLKYAPLRPLPQLPHLRPPQHHPPLPTPQPTPYCTQHTKCAPPSFSPAHLSSPANSTLLKRPSTSTKDVSTSVSPSPSPATSTTKRAHQPTWNGSGKSSSD